MEQENKKTIKGWKKLILNEYFFNPYYLFKYLFISSIFTCRKG